MSPARSSGPGPSGRSASGRSFPEASQDSTPISVTPSSWSSCSSTTSLVKTTRSRSFRSGAAARIAFQRARAVVTRKRALESLRMYADEPAVSIAWSGTGTRAFASAASSKATASREFVKKHRDAVAAPEPHLREGLPPTQDELAEVLPRGGDPGVFLMVELPEGFALRERSRPCAGAPGWCSGRRRRAWRTCGRRSLVGLGVFGAAPEVEGRAPHTPFCGRRRRGAPSWVRDFPCEGAGKKKGRSLGCPPTAGSSSFFLDQPAAFFGASAAYIASIAS